MFDSSDHMKLATYSIIFVLILLMLPDLTSSASPMYEACQAACNQRAIACYKAAGVAFGDSKVESCNIMQGSCMAACTPLLIVSEDRKKNI